MTVIYNTNFTHNPNAYLTLAVMDAARQVFGNTDVVLADNRTLAPLAAGGLHDVLICLDGQRLHEGLLRRVRHAFPTMILWLFEDPFMLDYNLRNIALFDFVLTNDPSCTAAYGAKGHYMPLAASLRFHHRSIKPDADLDYDIFFAGTMWPNRVRSLRRILTAFPDARLKLVCPTNEYLPPLPGDLARLAIPWPVSHASFIDFANASRVTLTMFREYASHGDIGQATAPGPRLFELACSGTAQVVECGDAMQSGRFEALHGIDLVRSGEALVGAVRRLLHDPLLRASQAIAAQDCALSSQLYTHRLQALRGITGGNFGVRTLPAASTAVARRLRVLMCTHSTIHSNEWGGVEVYQQTVAAMLERHADILFWLRRDGQCQLVDSAGLVLERFDMHPIGWLDSLTDAAEEAAFANVLGQYGFDLVHFQHLGHHAASLPIIAKACGVGTVFSAHDFFLVCSRYTLLNHDQVFCDIGHKAISACDICLRKAEDLPAGAQQTRRAFMVEVISAIDVFLFGTPYSEWLMLQVYPGLARRRRLVLGIPMPRGAAADVPRRHADAPDGRLVIAVVGNFLRAKGADMVMSLIEEANPALFRFHLLGAAEAQYSEVLARLDRPNVTCHGRYAPGDTSPLAQADVALHLSIWPETYCISLSEIWQAGLIPVVSDIGALGDRVEHGVNGFKVRVGDTSAVLDTLELLRASPALRRAIRAALGPHLWTDASDYAARLLETYRSVTATRPLGDARLGLDAGQLHLLPHATWKSLAPPRHIFDPSRRSGIRLELPASIQDWSHVQGSEVYIDSVCGVAPAMLAQGRFPPAAELLVSGWSFVPDLGFDGQVQLALVGEATAAPGLQAAVIFCPASRDVRDDIMASFPTAPRRSGFTACLTLRGKWCEGRYLVAIINSFGDRAAFCLTGLSVTVQDGRIVDAAQRAPSNEAVTRAFYRVAAQTGEEPGLGLPRVPVAPGAWRIDQGLRHHIDRISGQNGGQISGEADPTGFGIDGWAFAPGAGLAGRLYVALVDPEQGIQIVLPAPRELRGDLPAHFPDAPLCAGFRVRASLGGGGWRDGRFECVLVNSVAGFAALQVTGWRLEIRDGRIAASTLVEPDPVRSARVFDVLSGRWQPALPALAGAAPDAAPIIAVRRASARKPLARPEPAPGGRRRATVP
ncbi:glycosyltransferase family protein [Lichenicoccus sp.]|uniref:glycosyltransferase family protein n=1 Tax=Lichenicoccus sp. TaxID=2781899 RepID=UPI003D0ACB3E